MVTTALDDPGAIHIDRIVSDILAADPADRDWDRAAIRLLVAADFGDVLEGVR